MTPRRSFNASAGAFTPVASGGRVGAGRGGAGVIGFGCGLGDGCGAWGACAACGSVACGSAARDARDADGDSTSPVSNEATSDTGPSVTSTVRWTGGEAPRAVGEAVGSRCWL